MNCAEAPAFQGFPKVMRLEKSTVTITEKIDGTNACIVFDDRGIMCQSRKRVITPDDDNAGFAQWAYTNSEELFDILGEGRHFGEWWGLGIQRRYGLDHKVFSLFNTHRWYDQLGIDGFRVGDARLASVPLLGHTDMREVGWYSQSIASKLLWTGSHAAPFMDPEGLMLYFHAFGKYLKMPFDPAPKSASGALAA